MAASGVLLLLRRDWNPYRIPHVVIFGTPFCLPGHIVDHMHQCSIQASKLDIRQRFDVYLIKCMNGVRGSIAKLGLDPDNLSDGDKATMDFGGGGGFQNQGLARYLECRSGCRQHS